MPCGSRQKNEVIRMAEAKLEEILNYIEEREKNLSHYSDKLRNAIKQIFRVFGHSNMCRYCGAYEHALCHRRYYVSKDARTFNTLKEVREAYPTYQLSVIPLGEDTGGKWGDPKRNVLFVREVPPEARHTFKPKIEVSLNIDDEKPFYVKKGDLFKDGYTAKVYLLAIRSHELIILVKYEYPDYTEFKKETPDTVSREVLKHLVKSGRIGEFFKIVARELTEKEKEFKEVSKIAEKIMTVANPQPTQK